MSNAPLKKVIVTSNEELLVLFWYQWKEETHAYPLVLNRRLYSENQHGNLGRILTFTQRLTFGYSDWYSDIHIRIFMLILWYSCWYCKLLYAYWHSDIPHRSCHVATRGSSCITYYWGSCKHCVVCFLISLYTLDLIVFPSESTHICSHEIAQNSQVF